MIISTVKDYIDKRVALVPSSVKKLMSLTGVTVSIEQDLTEMYSDEEYSTVGADIKSREDVLKNADILLCVKKLPEEELKKLKPGTLLISFLDLFLDHEYLTYLKKYNLSSVSLEMIPRTTIAQKMDAVSSQASLAGYAAVIIGSNELNKILPMMMTPAGTIKPAKVFVIGAGVAGLQAIATSKRLGANIVAFDTRPAVKEEVESLGAKFLSIDLGETGQTTSGYATELTSEQLQLQQQEMTKVIQESDLVITTAKLFGRKAPIIIKKDVIKGMKSGAVIVDLAASTGGNVEGTKANEIVMIDGVKIIGYQYLEARVAKDASMMLSSNMTNFISHFWNNDKMTFDYKEDELLKGCLVTKDGSVVNEKIKEVIGG